MPGKLQTPTCSDVAGHCHSFVMNLMTTQKPLLAGELFRKPRLRLHISTVGVWQSNLQHQVRTLREQNQVVLSSRLSVGWRKNWHLENHWGALFSKAPMCVSASQCDKALTVVQRTARFAKARPRHGVGACCFEERGKMMDWNVYHLQGPKKKSQANQQEII